MEINIGDRVKLHKSVLDQFGDQRDFYSKMVYEVVRKVGNIIYLHSGTTLYLGEYIKVDKLTSLYT